MRKFKVLAAEPRIVLFPSFLSEEEVIKLIEVASLRWKDSTTVEPSNGDPVSTTYRTGKLSEITQDAAADIVKRISEVTKTRDKQCEGLQVLKYEVGNGYKEHTDWFDPRIPGIRKIFRHGGQRIYSVLIGLQEAEEGGELNFKTIGLKLKIKRGDAIIFEDIKTNGVPDVTTLHEALPVLKGEKLVSVTWVRERAFDGSEEPDDSLFYKREAQTIKAMRQDACTEELPKFLKHFGCVLAIEAIPVIADDGSISVQTEVKVKAIDVKEE
jgi:predicted 2-oxoglutarate/Fe(II)-dependent dioxygenase YbiX